MDSLSLFKFLIAKKTTYFWINNATQATKLIVTDKGMAWSRGIISEPDYYRSIDRIKKLPYAKKSAAKSLLAMPVRPSKYWKLTKIVVLYGKVENFVILGVIFLRFWKLRTVYCMLWIIINCPLAFKIFHFATQNSNLGHFSIFGRPRGHGQ